jgi:hypothetical protein
MYRPGDATEDGEHQQPHDIPLNRLAWERGCDERPSDDTQEGADEGRNRQPGLDLFDPRGRSG